jgi:hypothetical protein
MKKLSFTLTALGVTIAGMLPAWGEDFCNDPPGYPAGTAEYSYAASKDLGHKASANNGEPAPCVVSLGKGTPAIGKSIDTVYKCGGLTLVERDTYRKCNRDEILGLSSGSRVDGAIGRLKAWMCSQGRLMNDTSWRLKDRAGKVFELMHYEFRDNTEQSCLPDRKLSISTKEFRVGLTENYIQLISTTSYPLKRLAQPSL